MVNAFSSLKGLGRRLAKVEKMVKYILANCCGHATNLPTVDFIVDRFDRGNSGSLGRYWGESGAFQIIDQSAVSFKGAPATREEALPYLSTLLRVREYPVMSFAGIDRSTWDCERRSRIVDALTPSDKVCSTNTLAAYQAKLSSTNHHIEIGFTITEQEYEASPIDTVPSDDPDNYCFGEIENWWTPSNCYTSVASMIRPTFRYNSGEQKAGLSAHVDFGKTLGYSWQRTDAGEHDLPGYYSVIGDYSYFVPASHTEAEFDVSVTQESYIGSNIELFTFGETQAVGEFVLNSTTQWLLHGGFRFLMGPWTERGFTPENGYPDIGLWTCFSDLQETLVDVLDSKCLAYTRTHLPSGSTICWRTACSGQPDCTYLESPPVPLLNESSARVRHMPLNPPVEAPPVSVGHNVMRVHVVANTVTIELNGTTMAEFNQESVTDGFEVGMLAAGDWVTWANDAGLTEYPQITYFKAWADGTPEPSADESGHGTYENGQRIYTDAYHRPDENGDVGYDPLALDG